MIDATAHRLGVTLQVMNEVEPTNLKRELLLRHGRCSIVPYGLFLDEIRDGRLAARRIVGPTLTRRLYLAARQDFPRATTELLLAMFRTIVGALPDREELGWRPIPADAPAKMASVA
jgi:LysR family nitrogen assimilation transcriptional regulator